MLNKLIELCRTKCNIALYANENKTDMFYYGKILAVNSDFIAIFMFDEDGNEDGILVLPTHKIFRVDIGGSYEQKMDKLIVNKTVSLPTLTDGNLVEVILQKALDDSSIVSVELIDSGYDDIVGFVKSIENEICTFSLVDDYGKDDGEAFCNIIDVSQVTLSGKSELRRQKLHS